MKKKKEQLTQLQEIIENLDPRNTEDACNKRKKKENCGGLFWWGYEDAELCICIVKQLKEFEELKQAAKL